MYVACSTLCFPRLPLERALRLIGELEFSKVDIAIREQGPHLKPSEVVADPTTAAARLRIGPSLTPSAFTLEIESDSEVETTQQVKAICKLGRIAAVSIVTMDPGPAGAGLDAEVKRIGKIARIVQGEGLALGITTKIGTVTETPSGAVELCRRVPGLGLTLDPSHFVNGPHQNGSYDEVYPYVRHVHLRDSSRAPGKFQVRVGQGEIEYGKIISHLERVRYDRLLTVAVYDLPDGHLAMETEVRKLKFLLESLV